MASAEATAPARAALAGNPSDGYGGAVLAVALEGYAARVSARTADVLSISPPSELIEATVRRFARLVDPNALRTTVSWATAIPRSVGLGGSSAIIIAALRGLGELHGVTLDRVDLARFALAVETEELGIAAGLQDRVAQSFGGLTFMEFAGSGRFEALPAGLLPPIVVAWRPDTAAASGTVHSDLRERHAGGEPAVTGAMDELAGCARAARDALLDGDRAEFARCVDATFDVRRRLMSLDPRHVQMVTCARAHGAAANYTGSGGAIVAVCRDEEQRRGVADALHGIGCECTVDAL